MSNKRCTAVAELAVVLSRLCGSTSSAFQVADVASKLTSLEVSAQRHAERLCNEPMPEGADEAMRARIGGRVMVQLARLGLASIGFTVGGDPRGCCLRLMHPELPRNAWGDGYAVGC